MSGHDIPRMTIAEIIDELRSAADETGDIEGIDQNELVESQAAQVIEELQSALLEIADGAEDPKAVARAALAAQAPLKPPGGIEDTIKRLLRPRR